MFRGSYTVMVTPFKADGSLDEDQLRKFVDWQIEQGVHGLIPLGSTGEFLSLTRDERHSVAAIVVEQARKRVPVIVGTAAEWTDEACELSRDAQALGADGVMVVPPYYSSPTEDEIFEHYRRIGESVSIPVMVYNNPNTANVDIKPNLIARLTQIDTVLYIKESSGSVNRITRIMDLCGDRMTVFAGYDAWESFRCGAQGCVSVLGNIAPALASDLFNTTVNDQRLEPGYALYRRLLPLFDALSGDLYVGATKAALRLTGMPVGHPRPPRLPIPENRLAHLKSVLGELGLLART
jgi:4-hydroxy-tetrahydrodipicolinate synthase